MTQSSVQKCDFTDVVEYMIDPDNIWNPEKYVQRSLTGKSFGEESVIRMHYVRGSGYAEGHVGNHKFMLFFSHIQGWQLHWTGTLSDGSFEPHQVKSFGPDRESSLLGIVKDRVTYTPRV